MLALLLQDNQTVKTSSNKGEKMTKLSSVRVRMQSENLDAIIITNLKNIYYLSAFWGTAGTILVTQRRNIY